jgi:hypothetical protein
MVEFVIGINEKARRVAKRVRKVHRLRCEYLVELTLNAWQMQGFMLFVPLLNPVYKSGLKG